MRDLSPSWFLNVRRAASPLGGCHQRTPEHPLERTDLLGRGVLNITDGDMKHCDMDGKQTCASFRRALLGATSLATLAYR